MAKYLIFGSYTQQGVQGLLKDGGSSRRAAVSLTVSASGAVNPRTVPLLTAEEIDAAVKQSPAYKAPGK